MLRFLLICMSVHSVLSACSPCKEVEGDGPLAGTYALTSQSDMRCDNGCVYEMEPQGSSQDRYCFEIQETMYRTQNCTQVETARLIIEENGEIIEQKQEYNPDTGDISIQVGQHGTRNPLTILINTNSDVMTAVTGDVCEIKSLPGSVEPKTIAGNRTTDEDTVTEEMEETEYSLSLQVGEPTQQEIDMMGEAGGAECEGKKIVKTEERKLSKQDFDTLTSGGLVEIGGGQQKRFKRDSNCTLQRKCASRGSGCWRWPYGLAFSIHMLNADVVCVDCCTSGSSEEFCSCADIVDVQTLGQCSSTNGTCAAGFYLCDGVCTVQTNGILRKCSEGCTDGMKSCGNFCIPSAFQDNYRECDGECLRPTEACNGNCPAGFTVCGVKCVLDSAMGTFYKLCNGQCRTVSELCDGECQDGYYLCGSTCRQLSSDGNNKWRDCNGSCLHQSQACAGECPEDFSQCGNSTRCIQEDDTIFKDCKGSCISYSEQCEDTCGSGSLPCGDKCIPEDQRYQYHSCGGNSCLSIFQQCNGTCTLDSMVPCGDYDCVNNTGRYMNCNGRCQDKSYPCDGACDDGWTSCGNYTCIREQGELTWRTCGEECMYRSVPCNGSCMEGDYLCNGRCIDQNQACGSECAPGWSMCGNSTEKLGLCYSSSSNDSIYYPCGDSCIPKLEFCANQTTCFQDYQECGYSESYPSNKLCFKPGGLVQPCNGKCMLDGRPCDGECPAGWNICRAGWTYGEGDLYLDVCYNDSQESPYFLKDGYCWKKGDNYQTEQLSL